MGALNAVVWPEHLLKSLVFCMERRYLDGRERRLSVRRSERDMSDRVVCVQQS